MEEARIDSFWTLIETVEVRNALASMPAGVMAVVLRSASSRTHGQSVQLCLCHFRGFSLTCTATRADRTGAQERTKLKARGAVLKGRLHIQRTTVSQLDDQYTMVERPWVPCARL